MPPQKQSFSIYTMMLIVAFFALTISWVLLKNEVESYDANPPWNTKVAAPAPAPPAAAAPAAAAPAGGAPAGGALDGGAPPAPMGVPAPM